MAVQNLSISQKIWLSLAILIVGFFGTMSFGFIRGKRTERRLFTTSESYFPATQQSHLATSAFNEQIKMYNDAVVMGEVDVLEAAQQKARICQDALGRIAALEGLDTQDKATVQDLHDKLAAFTHRAQSVYQRMCSNAEDSMDADSGVSSLEDQMIALGRQTEVLQQRLSDKSAYFSKHLKDELAAMGAASVQQRYLSLGVFVIVLATSTILVTFIVTHYIITPLKKTLEVIKDVADGDLTQSVEVSDGHDEISDLARHSNIMINTLKEILGSIQSVVWEITNSGQEILTISETQATSATQQASAVTETTAAAAELSTTSEHIGESIKTVSEMAHHVLTGMEKIKTASDQTNRLLVSLDAKSQEIGSILELIDDVAEQTNLLAVNAAIEAARAGEQGRGFTVVADQIGKLADSTSKSTKDIASLIELIQHEMGNAIDAMNTSLTSVEDEIQLAEASASQSQEIALNANQQIVGSRQIAEAMTSIDESMKDMADGAQKSSNTAGQLTLLADKLKSSMIRFKFTHVS